MPRNASKVFYNLPGTEGFPDTTIESVKYNNYISDVAFDLNLPRPIIAGGTGADDADEALINLSAEKASQFVSNFDEQIWLPGSFRSSTGATGSPVSGHAFVGTVHINDFLTNPPLNENVVITARDMNDTVTPKRVYVREKKANIWGSWVVIDATTLPFTPGGSISATTIQAAIQELDTEKASLVYVDNKDTALTAYVDSNINDTIVFLDSEITAVQDDLNTLAATIGAPPYALAANGMQLNGDFSVGQYGGAVTATGPLTDCWRLTKVGTMGLNANIGTFHSMETHGFQTALSVACTTAQTTLGAGDYVIVHQPIEGYRMVKLKCGGPSGGTPQPMTLAFWSINNPGLYSVSVHNRDTYCYVTTYTQGSGGPQYNIINIPGAPPGGTWETDLQVGLRIVFCAACGSTYTAPTINTWLGTGPYYAAPGQVNGMAAVGVGGLAITGVVLFPGIQTLSAANSALFMRPTPEEYELCRRYYYDRFVTIDGYAAAGSTVMQYFPHPVMHHYFNPTITHTGGTATNNSGVVTTTFGPAFTGYEGFKASITATATGLVRLEDVFQVVDGRLP